MILPMRYSAIQKEPQKTPLANATPTGRVSLLWGEHPSSAVTINLEGPL